MPNTKGINKVLQSFLEKCWCEDLSKRIEFGDVVDIIMSSEFRNVFDNLDNNKIENFLDLFDNDLKDLESMNIKHIQKEKDDMRESALVLKRYADMGNNSVAMLYYAEALRYKFGRSCKVYKKSC